MQNHYCVPQLIPALTSEYAGTPRHDTPAISGQFRSAATTWPAEVEKWEHLADLDVSVIVGDVKARTAALNHNALVYVINRENVKWLVEYYWFKHDRQRIIENLESIGYKFGKTLRDIKDSEDIKLWNAGQLPVALIHPASAGHGLNIQQGGHILIWFGLTWSLELYQQTNARLWRQGQTHVVTIHHIITKNTVDEDVMAALEQKDMTQEKLISAVKAQLGR